MGEVVMKKIALAGVALAALVMPAAAGIKSAGGSTKALPPGSQPVDAAGKDNKGSKGKKVGKAADPCAVASGGALVKATDGGNAKGGGTLPAKGPTQQQGMKGEGGGTLSPEGPAQPQSGMKNEGSNMSSVGPGVVDLQQMTSWVIKESYEQTTKDLKAYAEKVEHYNKLKDQIRDEPDKKRDYEGAGSGAVTDSAQSQGGKGDSKSSALNSGLSGAGGGAVTDSAQSQGGKGDSKSSALNSGLSGAGGGAVTDSAQSQGGKADSKSSALNSGLSGAGGGAVTDSAQSQDGKGDSKSSALNSGLSGAGGGAVTDTAQSKGGKGDSKSSALNSGLSGAGGGAVTDSAQSKGGTGGTAGTGAANPNARGGGSGVGPIAGLTKPSDPCATPRASKQTGKPAQKPLPNVKPKTEVAAKQGKSCPPGMQPNRSGTGCLPSLDGGADFSVGSGMRASGGGVGGTAASPGGGCRKC
jgi:hypothetical protein